MPSLEQAEGMQVGCAKLDELSDVFGVKSTVLGKANISRKGEGSTKADSKIFLLHDHPSLRWREPRA